MQLGQGAGGRVDHPRGRVAGGGEQGRDHGHGLVGVEEQRRDDGAGAQPVAALGARGRLDLVAEATEPVDVAAHGACRDPEPGGELGPGPVGPAGQRRQQRQRPSCGVGVVIGHHRRVSHVEDRTCPQGCVPSGHEQHRDHHDHHDHAARRRRGAAVLGRAGGRRDRRRRGRLHGHHRERSAPPRRLGDARVGRRTPLDLDVRQLAEGGQPAPLPGGGADVRAAARTTTC